MSAHMNGRIACNELVWWLIGGRERTIAGREWLPRESNARTAGLANALDLDALRVRWAAMRPRTATNGLNGSITRIVSRINEGEGCKTETEINAIGNPQKSSCAV